MKWNELEVICRYPAEGEELRQLLLASFECFLVRELGDFVPVAEHPVCRTE
ncbi:MAG TPA: hypothetical protein H9841_00275 [Candidatus Flavonifractor merdigallinarum]|uniref:Uncharacterized protein n=1 Tax=Candidatus Flavonifractor merdigallinarum TaxID=2838589 RepID=A0A9D1Y9I7_9FIRM|nr:hypothetical protein [Candidatus Flavonifractor merdigallinarum]